MPPDRLEDRGNDKVRDTQTGLEWKMGNNQDRTWAQANNEVGGMADYDMPTKEQLLELNGARDEFPRKNFNEFACCYIWSSEEMTLYNTDMAVGISLGGDGDPIVVAVKSVSCHWRALGVKPY